MEEREYLPPTIEWVRKQVEVYEATNGEKGYTLLDTGMPCIIVTHIGKNTGAIRKIPLMRVKSEDSYVLIGSMGGQPTNPVWVYNLRARSEVEIRDKGQVSDMIVREVTDLEERERLWDLSVKTYPPYADYQAKTERVIPVFLAEPKQGR